MNARRPRLTPQVADARRAVRAHIDDLVAADATLILVALSGGADSLALAAATAFEADRTGLRAGAVIIDHGLQLNSAEVAERAASQAHALGLDPVIVRRVQVSGAGGPEATARQARYHAFDEVAVEHSADAIFLGHTLDDQAETVLLGLARGSGGTSLSGMAEVNGLYRRPLLGIHRATTWQVCEDSGLEPWHDPHNHDQQYARVRVRRTVLPTLEAQLGPGITEALARSAEQSREDSEALDAFTTDLLDEAIEPAESGVALSVAVLDGQPAAIRNRLIRLVVKTEFELSLTREHTLAVARLVTDWHGQAALHLPSLRVHRDGQRIVFTAHPGD